jgi:tripartite ATP-independent transporter DctP family solute receptor
MKRSFSIVLFVALLVVLCVCSSPSESAETQDLESALASMEPIMMRFGTNQSSSSVAFAGCKYWADQIKEKSGGKITIEVYESNTLGSQADMLDGLKMGTIEISFNSPATMSAAVPSVAVLDLPYIFTSKEQAYKVLDGEIGLEIFSVAEKQEGYYVLAVFEGGFRQSVNSKRDVASLADYRGLKFRCPESQVYLRLYEKLGAIPTAMDMSEVFTSLQNGTVDGTESPIFTIYSNSWYEAASHLTIDNHIYACNPILVSAPYFDKLPSAVQAMLRETCQKAAVWERARTTEREDGVIADMESKGVTVTRLSDERLKEIQEAVKTVWDDFEGKIGAELIEKVANAR